MPTKQELTKQSTTLQKSIDDLKKRRATLAADAERTATAIEAKTKEIGAALLDARDTTREAEALTRLKRDLDGLKEAVILADQRLEAQEAELSHVQRDFFMIDFEAAKDEALRLFLECLTRLRSANQAVEAMGAQLKTLHEIGSKSGIIFEFDGHLPLLEKVYGSLDASLGGAQSIMYRINQLEQSYPALMTYARARKQEKGW